jgi:hypothetical protein
MGMSHIGLVGKRYLLDLVATKGTLMPTRSTPGDTKRTRRACRDDGTDPLAGEVGP